MHGHGRPSRRDGAGARSPDHGETGDNKISGAGIAQQLVAARELAMKKELPLAENARLFALLNMSLQRLHRQLGRKVHLQFLATRMTSPGLFLRCTLFGKPSSRNCRAGRPACAKASMSA